MWEDWKKAWQEAVDNFEREVRAPDAQFASPGARTSAMQRDLNAARAALTRLQGDIAQSKKDLSGEEESEQTARRRAEMAQRIDDAETARIALEFAARHTQRADILRRKVTVLEEELAMRQEELAVMEQQVANAPPERSEKLAADDFDYRKLDRERREKEAEARLEELKKRMR